MLGDGGRGGTKTRETTHFSKEDAHFIYIPFITFDRLLVRQRNVLEMST